MDFFLIGKLMNSNVNQAVIPEIVAPAGSMESFSAALNARADAIYVGIRDYNMRASSEAFGIKQIREMISRAHDRGTKFYLALNIIAYDNQLSEIARILDSLADAGADAVILWDMGILRLAKEREFKIHLSTQASVSNTESATFYESLGVKRIVLARELSLGQIKKAVESAHHRESEMTFECFVHGAMCIAVSGRCLTSQFFSGRSANCGDCLQPCRRKYRITDIQEGDEMILNGHTVMSAKDLCTIDILDHIIGTGVSALKIEGRMRETLYVKTAVECYREARDAVLDGSYSETLAGMLKERLSRVFNRGFSHGFYFSRPDLDIAESEGSISKYVKDYAGRIVNFYKKAGAADVQLEARGISLGDTVLVTGPTTGALEFTADSIRSPENISAETSARGELIGLALPSRARTGDKVFVLVSRDRQKGKE
ncbi:peptidase U32 family protein [Candidatus Latescibacterota bacterium]